jgi:hypothetical protein
MKNLIDGLRLIMIRRDSRMVFVIAVFTFLIGVVLVQNGKNAFPMLGFESIPALKRISLFFGTLFDITSVFTPVAFTLAVVSSFIGAVNISLAYTYMRLRGEVIVGSGLYSGTGLVFAFFGVHCFACGTALLSVLFSFFGLGAVLKLLPYHGQEIAFLGLLIIFVATYSLAQKVKVPNVC